MDQLKENLSMLIEFNQHNKEVLKEYGISLIVHPEALTVNFSAESSTLFLRRNNVITWVYVFEDLRPTTPNPKTLVSAIAMDAIVNHVCGCLRTRQDAQNLQRVLKPCEEFKRPRA